MAPARGQAGSRLWKSREKQEQNTVKRNNRRDHQRPGRRIIRILKRKGETFRISLHWGGGERGCVDSHLFQPNKHNQSIHQCWCKLWSYKNCIKGGCFSSVHHRGFQRTPRLCSHCSHWSHSECVRWDQQRERKINGWFQESPRQPSASFWTSQSSLHRWSSVSHASFPSSLHPSISFSFPAPQTALPCHPNCLTGHLGTFYPRVHRLTFCRQISRWMRKEGPTVRQTLKIVLNERILNAK